MALLEGLTRTAVLAARLMACPGDDILMVTAGTAKSLGSSEGIPPAAFLYERSPVLRLRKTDRNGNRIYEPVPYEVVVFEAEYPEIEEEAVTFTPRQLELAGV